MLKNRIYVYSFPDNPRKLFEFDTRDNPKGERAQIHRCKDMKQWMGQRGRDEERKEGAHTHREMGKEAGRCSHSQPLHLSSPQPVLPTSGPAPPLGAPVAEQKHLMRTWVGVSGIPEPPGAVIAAY